VGQRGGCIAHGERPTCAALRLLAYQVVLAVFSEYDAHRKVLLQDLLEARLTQPTGLTRDARRNYPLPNGARIQTFTALCALLMQSGEDAAAAAARRGSVCCPAATQGEG
jgi:hypothetical protein